MLSCDLYSLSELLGQTHFTESPAGAQSVDTPPVLPQEGRSLISLKALQIHIQDAKIKVVSRGGSLSGLELRECKSLLRLPLLSSCDLPGISARLESRYGTFATVHRPSSPAAYKMRGSKREISETATQDRQGVYFDKIARPFVNLSHLSG